MHKIIYVDWDTKSVITTNEELKDLIESYVEDMKQNKPFAEYLEQNYFTTEVFEMDEAKKKQVKKDYDELMRLEVAQILERTLEPVFVSLGEEINLGWLYKGART